MSTEQYSFKAEAASGQGQDRVSVFEADGHIVLLLADGAGVHKGAEQVSERFIDLMKAKLINDSIPKDPLVLEHMLRNIDVEISRQSKDAESTAICIIVKDTAVWGVSIGDSECWMFNKEYEYELTTNQYRKPMLGSGKAVPVAFGPFNLDGFIVVGSDGLFKYTTIEKIKEVLNTIVFDKISESLINLVRLQSGALQDDCSVIVYKA